MRIIVVRFGVEYLQFTNDNRLFENRRSLCILDRIIQQCFKQVLEPIAEARFYKHSYGFRPLRSTHHAMARVQFLVNQASMHYVVDIAKKGFFENVNHTLLLKQLWNMGLRDRKVLACISKMLKAEIDGEGIPAKGLIKYRRIQSYFLIHLYGTDHHNELTRKYDKFCYKRRTA